MTGIIWNSIVDHIPLWGWIVIFGVPIGALLYFFGPILYPIWRMLPLPIRVGLIGLGAAILAFLGGRYRGRQNAEEEDRRRNAEALNKRTEVERDTSSKSDKQVHNDLQRWNRDD